MADELKVLSVLEDYILKNHASAGMLEALSADYEYISVEYEGPYIDEETEEEDENCIMYLINVDSHLSGRLKAEDKYSLQQTYDTLYGWIYLDKNVVDIVGVDNYYGNDRTRLINNLDALFKYASKK